MRKRNRKEGREGGNKLSGKKSKGGRKEKKRWCKGGIVNGKETRREAKVGKEKRTYEMEEMEVERKGTERHKNI